MQKEAETPSYQYVIHNNQTFRKALQLLQMQPDEDPVINKIKIFLDFLIKKLILKIKIKKFLDQKALVNSSFL